MKKKKNNNTEPKRTKQNTLQNKQTNDTPYDWLKQNKINEKKERLKDWRSQ